MGGTLAYPRLEVSLSICREFHCAMIVMLLRAPLSHPVARPPGQACLSSSRGGGVKQPTSLSSQPHTPLLLPGDSTCLVQAVAASFPSSLFPAARFNPASNLHKDHLFKNTKHNLDYMEYGQHIYSLCI